MANAGQSREGVPLACGIILPVQERCDKLRSIGDEGRGVLVDGSNSIDGVLPDVGVSVLEAGPGRGQEGLDQFGLAKLAEEAESVSSDVLVGVLEVIPNTVAENM